MQGVAPRIRIGACALVWLLTTPVAHAQDLNSPFPPGDEDAAPAHAYWGPHPDGQGGWCPLEGAHTHAYLPFDPYLFTQQGDEYYFIGDPSDFGYTGALYDYYGVHPIEVVYGGDTALRLAITTTSGRPAPTFMPVTGGIGMVAPSRLGFTSIGRATAITIGRCTRAIRDALGACTLGTRFRGLARRWLATRPTRERRRLARAGTFGRHRLHPDRVGAPRRALPWVTRLSAHRSRRAVPIPLQRRQAAGVVGDDARLRHPS
jgi:hypothetical protein